MTATKNPARRRKQIVSEDDIKLWDTISSSILLNAIRLLDDARALRLQRRYASATALAVLSLEEVGKYALVHPAFRQWLGSTTEKRTTAQFTHKQKQHACAEVIKMVLPFPDLMQLVGIAGFEYILIPKGSAPEGVNEKLIDSKLIAAISEKKLFELSKEGALRDYVLFFALLMKGTFDDIKRKCFYIDDAPTGSPIAEKIPIDRRISDGAIKLSGKALWAAKMHLKRSVRCPTSQRQLD